jgi:DNA-binding transcriptional MerR regulator
MDNPDASVTIETAAELANVDAHTIRRWSEDGLLQIDQRGQVETVQQADVLALAALRTTRSRGARRGSLRGLLREADRPESLDVTGLQELVRERATSKRRGWQ